MSLGEYVSLAIVTGLIAIILMSLLLGYKRRISRFWRTVGWCVSLALIAVPLVSFILGISLVGDAPEFAREDTGSDQAVAPSAPTQAKRPASSSVRSIRKPEGATDTETITAAPAQPEPEASVEEPAQEEVLAAEVELETAAAPQNSDFDKVDVFFGTDRDRVSGGDRVRFGKERAGELTLGKAQVSVPKKNHARGIVERPSEWSVFGITVYREKEDPKKHFTVQEIGVLDENTFLQAANAKLAASSEYRRQAVVFVHGYNNDFDTALYRSAQMIYDMRFDGAPFLYSWPSAAGYSDYERDQQSARQSIPHLRRFIQLVTEKTNADKIHLVAHSMGNDVLLEALRELRFQYGPDHDYKINQVVLAAPDVDRDVFESLARQISGMSKGVTLYASANDKALQASNAYAGGVRAGDVPPGGPVILSGIDTIDVSATQQDFWGLNHNSYAEVSELQKDIKALLLRGVRPPKSRTPSLEPVKIPSGTFWRFPGRQ